MKTVFVIIPVLCTNLIWAREPACSGPCPTGYFETKPCTSFSDRVCIECSQCGGAMYEARPCTATSDRYCMHVAHPLLIKDDQTTPSFLEGLKIDASKNVFLEDLHSTRNLESAFFMTNLKQSSDFHWERESGLRVNIGVLNVQLLPEYEDVDHKGDNKYMLNTNYPNNEDKDRFTEIVEHYCRHPIPDYYSLTLEVTKDRTTIAEEITCDSHDTSLPGCPDGYNDGDRFLHRTLNDPCTKMGTFPAVQEPAANSIVCTQNNDMLKQIFNINYTIERPIRFPGRKCKSAHSRCEQCLKQSRCQMTDIFELKCCQIDCYTLPDCKYAESVDCSRAAIECAMGDSYRYTLQPVFKKIKEEFQCHLKRKKKKVLYEMFFFIEIPEKRLITPKVYRTVYADDIETASKGEYQADYITVEHNTGLDLEEDFILRGTMDDTYIVNYTVSQMKRHQDYTSSRIHVHTATGSSSISVASTQVASPFAYSTSSWLDGEQCNKMVSRFKPEQTHYTDNSDQYVSVINQQKLSPDRGFQYWFQSTQSSPYIRFIVPGNTSVLPWYFQDNGTLLTDDSLSATLELTAAGKIWEIHITGQMSSCPGYLGVTINSRQDQEELFKYDMLVLCPPSFNLSFKIPNFGLFPEKTFDVIFKDSKKTYSIFLTQIVFENEHGQTGAQQVEHIDQNDNTIVIITTVAACVSFVLIILLFVYIRMESRRSQITGYPVSKSVVQYGHPNEPLDIDHSCIPSYLHHGQIIFVASYILIRIIYSLLFTYTIFFAVFTIYIRSQVLTLGQVKTLQVYNYNDSKLLTTHVDKLREQEILKQNQLTDNMRNACSYYITEMFDSLIFQMDNSSANERTLTVYNNVSTISFSMKTQMEKLIEEYRHSVSVFTEQFKPRLYDAIKPAIIRYRRYLSEVFKSDWFKFPQNIFNQSHFATSRQQIFKDNSNLSGEYADFGAFLEIEEVEQVQLWTSQLWERYRNRMPVSLLLPVPVSQHNHKLQCKQPSRRPLRQQPHHLDASRYFTSGFPIDENLDSLSEDHTENHFEDNIFSLDVFLDSLNLSVLRVVFLLLDAILVIYRFSNTYLHATTLCRGFEHTRHNIKMPGKILRKFVQNGGKDRPSEDLFVDKYSQVDPKSGYSQQSTSLHSDTVNNTAKHYLIKTSSGNSELDKNDYESVSCCRIFQETVVKIIESNIMPVVLISVALLCVLHVVILCVVGIIDSGKIYDIYLTQIRFLGADTHVNETNVFLVEQTDILNQNTMVTYEQNMRLELYNLQSMLEYFNKEHKRVFQNYRTETCAVNKLTAANESCGLVTNAPYLELPLLPCNFVPIYDDYTDLYPAGMDITSHYEPLLAAIRSFVTKIGYAAYLVVVFYIITHIAGIVLFHYLKCGKVFPIQHILVMSSLPSCRNGRNHQQGDDSESDDQENGYHNVSLKGKAKSNSNKGLLTGDFKYSETKV